MRCAFFLFFFLLIFLNYKVRTGKCSELANVSNPANNFFLSLNKIKITALDILNDYKKERNIITKVFEKNQHENDYIFINEKINSYNSINITCTFKAKKKIDKTNFVVLLVKHFEGDIDHSKKDETFIFTNTYENDLIISNLSFLLVNLTAMSGYYKFDVFITDGQGNLMFFKLVKIFLYFHNNIPIIQYPIKGEAIKRETIKKRGGSIIIEHICKNKLMINNSSLNVFNKLVVHNFKEYYPQPLISERQYFTHNYVNKRSSENGVMPIIHIILIVVFFIIYIYFIIFYMKYNIKIINISYINYAFVFSFICIIFLFILYDLYFNVLEIYRIFILFFSFFLFLFFKTLTNLEKYRKID
ncbi:conserved Plasmodium protein, unknown function [Plasmodium chabaudi chabaudi]|uniref:Dolichyl-diphosphooligosaccharide--protein glycosyltransferase subunit 2 n=1 Tax=Plasmodium chabaudi chabaudi TaxID=31271 RepID=A0A1D3S1T5_PLACU|nr:conserved Plasmodium protein, unknown function [Plasmodium chabaudi chabaudi]